MLWSCVGMLKSAIFDELSC